MDAPVDTLHRPLRELRISVTDRCNFRCPYCMPKEQFGSKYHFLPRSSLLSFEEIHRIVRIFASLGVRKLRLTGGEPLLRRDLDRLIRMLAEIPQIDDLSLTTNGALLTREAARRLKEAGLQRISISLDTLDEEVFQAMNGVQFPLRRVLQAIEHAAAVGLAPIKVNMVVKRGVNDQAILPMARHFRGSGQILRFIEYMDVGNSNDWCSDAVLPSTELLEKIHPEFPLEALPSNHPGEVAKRWRYVDGGGEIGVITSVTEPFCEGCTRARISAAGMLHTCLFASHGHDLRAPLRSDAPDEQLRQLIGGWWEQREDRYSALRASQNTIPAKIEMSYIGG